MQRYYSITLAALLVLTPMAQAAETPAETAGSEAIVTKDAAGLGIGALIGGVLGGPIGAIAGGAGGAWLGDREAAGDDKREQLAGQLAARTAELEQLKSELAALESRADAAAQPVRLDSRNQTAEQLSRALNIAVYFRTDSSELQADARQRLRRIASQLHEYEQIRLHVAGYADRRGDQDYNQRLSRRRAEAVADLMQQAGIDADRIHVEAHGQSRAQATPEDDLEAYMFDRRVNIELSLTDPV